MESNLVNPYIKLIEEYFESHLPNFYISSSSFSGPFWEITFSFQDISIKISGDIAFSIELTIEKSKFQLWQYDRSINKYMQTTTSNIIYQLNTLKRFLAEKN